MDASSVVKVVAAFVGGVVVALGSALVYVRVTQTPIPQAPAATITLPAPVQLPEEAPTEPEPIKQQPVTQQPVKQPKPRIEHQLKPAPKPIVHKQLMVPVQIAKNEAPPALSAQIAIQEPTPAEPPAPAPQPDPAPVTPAPQPHVVTLDAGTTLPVRLAETLSTDHNYTGDTFRATLEAPLIMEGFIIADRGSKVLGRIVSAQKAGRFQGTADLNLVLTEINTTDGQRIAIETNSYDRRGSSNAGEDTAKIAGGAALGAIIGGIAGGGKGAAIGSAAGGGAGFGVNALTHGQQVRIPSETVLTFRLRRSLTITP